MKNKLTKIWDAKRLIEDISELLEMGKDSEEILFSLDMKINQQLKEI